jgi:hypothetical protein
MSDIDRKIMVTVHSLPGAFSAEQQLSMSYLENNVLVEYFAEEWQIYHLLVFMDSVRLFDFTEAHAKGSYSYVMDDEVILRDNLVMNQAKFYSERMRHSVQVKFDVEESIVMKAFEYYAFSSFEDYENCAFPVGSVTPVATQQFPQNFWCTRADTEMRSFVDSLAELDKTREIEYTFCAANGTQSIRRRRLFPTELAVLKDKREYLLNCMFDAMDELSADDYIDPETREVTLIPRPHTPQELTIIRNQYIHKMECVY